MVSVSAGYNEMMYNLYFCWYLCQIVRKPLLDSRKILSKVHAVNLVATVFLVSFAQYHVLLGKSLFGTCSVSIFI